ncbi:hypothetical protein Vadar_018939 [Vaccinium darrowii]|uniref:Uncharacterized protein n=1 Tax=Vaccinium darrowii TaxID=229202 RepID=A0ACB7X2C0_9ERIC|nr:hypothetical protein Vadar_018939 [Vaccinium darrowii]
MTRCIATSCKTRSSVAAASHKTVPATVVLGGVSLRRRGRSRVKGWLRWSFRSKRRRSFRSILSRGKLKKLIKDPSLGLLLRMKFPMEGKISDLI